jgi:pentatricopeptide repeat protein
MEAVDDEVTRVQFAENIDHTIDYLWELHENGYHDVKPDVFLYTTAVDAWALAQSSQSALRAQMLVDDLKARHEETGEPDLKPDIAIYNALIKAIARQPGLVEAAEKAGVIVRSLEEDDTIEPDVFTYNGLIQACLASPHDITKAEQTLGRMILTGMPIPNESSFRSVIHALLEIPGGTSRAEALLDRMEERYLPKASLYERIIFSWCEQVGMADRARRLLERMEQLFAEQDRSESLRPNRALYGAVIRALEDQGDTLSAEEVRTRRDAAYGDVIINEKLRSNSQVFALLKEVDANLSGETPSGNTYNFNYVLSLLADSGKIWTGLRAEDVLNYMLELTFKRKNIEAAPDIVTFNSVIACWARSNHPLATEKAPGVLRKLEELHDMGLLEDVVADRVTYNTLMSVYAKSYENEGSARKAQECFDKLVHLYEQTGDKRYMPDVVSYSTLLSAWARSREVGNAKRAEDILVKMHEAHVSDPINNPQPDTVCFNEVLYAWARSNEANADRRAEMVLELMKEMDRNGDSKVVPNTRTYNIVLLALANSPKKDSPIRAMKLLDDMNKISNAKPDLVSYNTAISTFLKQGSVNGALQMLEELFVRNDVVLDSKFFASLINSIAEAGPSDAPVIAEGIVLDLLEKRKWKVDVEVFNALINCWGRSGTTDAARRAYDILQDMIDGKYGAEPNVVTFTSVINIWAKSGAPDSAERAEEVLNQIISFKGVEPNVQTYTATIQAMARSNYRDKARRAQEILNLMKDDFSRGNRDAEPTVFAYNAVLNAAEYTVGNEADLEQAFRVACETFDQVRSSDTLKPDHVTYGTFMGVISQLMPESDIRNDMIQLVFRRCCVDGQLAPVVMKKFREAADSQQFLQLMGKVVEDNLPQEWTCNVRGARQYI